jgi:hypothetical protein
MKNLVSPFFRPIYEGYFLTIKSNKSISKNKKMADAIFHQREFSEWLRFKYKDKLTSETFSKLANAKNFQLYISKYHKLIIGVDEKKKRQAIYDQVRLSKLKSISKHEYDVDIVESYFKIKELLENVKIRKGVSKEDYIKTIRYPIENYCNEFDLPITQILQMKYPIIVTSNIQGFDSFFGRTLMAFDINKIEAILSYQNALWKGKGLFPSFVEHGVYRFIMNNSPFDNTIRLGKIMDWVNRNRIFLKPEVSKNDDNNKSKATLDFGIENIKVNNYTYWPYSDGDLKKLYDTLVFKNMIYENDSFYELFKIYTEFPKNPIEWRWSPNQLMYLLYLIFNMKKDHEGYKVHDIACRIFKNSVGNFYKKNLNTILNQVINCHNDKQSLSYNLKTIKTIFDELKLVYFQS